MNKKNGKSGKKEAKYDSRQQKGRNNKFDPKYGKGATKGQETREYYRRGSDTSTYDGKCNDPAWWNPNDAYYNQVTNIAFGTRVGETLRTSAPALPMEGGVLPEFRVEFTTPGVVSIAYIPTIGNSDEQTDAINQAASALFNVMNKANGRVPQYNKSDVIMNIIAMDSVFQGIAFLERAYFTTNLWLATNTFAPRNLIGMMNIEFPKTIEEATLLKSEINSLILQARTIAVPKNFSLFDRHIELCANIYKDRDSDRCNFYVFNPKYLYSLEYDDELGKVLKPIEFAYGTAKPWRTFVKMIRNLLNNIYDTQDIGQFTADLINALGADAMYTLNPINDPNGLSVISPIYDEQLMNQLHNANVVDVDPEYLTIIQTVRTNSANIVENLLEVRPRSTWRSATNFDGAAGTQLNAWRAVHAPDAHLLDFHVGVEHDSIMVGTRLKTAGKVNYNPEDNQPTLQMEYYPGSEMIVDITVALKDPAGALSTYRWNAGSVLPGVFATSDLDKLLYQIEMDYQISHMPIRRVGIVMEDVDSGNIAFVKNYANTDNVTKVTDETLMNLHKCALMGVFDASKLLK